MTAGRPLVGHEVKRLLVWELSRRDPTASGSLSASTGLPAGGRLRHAGGCLHPQRGPAQPVPGGHLRGAAGRHPARAGPARRQDAGGGRGVRRRCGAGRAHRRASRPTRRCDASSMSWSCPWSPSWPTWRPPAWSLDRAALSALAGTFREAIDRLAEDIYASVGHEFNLGSPKQLEQVLFYELDLPRGKRTKTGYSTDAQVLEELRAAHPMIPMLLDWRIYTKLRSTYVEALPILIDPTTGRLHTTFQQAVAATGRLSSADPNLQNIPIRTELGRRIRSAFVAGGRGPRAAGRRLQPDRAAGAGPRLGRRPPSGGLRAARSTSIARPRRACCGRIPPTSPPTSAPWPRWSTSASPTA